MSVSVAAGRSTGISYLAGPTPTCLDSRFTTGSTLEPLKLMRGPAILPQERQKGCARRKPGLSFQVSPDTGTRSSQ